MKLNSQICTTREQSERLLALGLKKETADMVILEHPRKEGRYFYFAKEDVNWDGFPAWSLHRLIEMMPCGFQDVDYRSFVLCINSQGVSYEYHFVDEDGNGYSETDGVLELFDNLYDDIIAHIEWLIKEEHFNKEYLEEQYETIHNTRTNRQTDRVGV